MTIIMIDKRKKFKALMLDLDGTTVPSSKDGRPSKKVIEGIAKARKKLHVGVVTGRPYHVAEHIIAELGLNGPSITTGGAEVRDAETGAVLWSKKISDETAKAILRLMRRRHLPTFVTDNNHYKEQKLFDPKYPTKDPLQLAIPDLSLSIVDDIHQELNQFTDVSVHKAGSWKPNTVWLSITHGEATKQHSILEVARILGINTHEIIGVGDADNDFPLLMACGLRVAMGNAVESLKDIADYVAPTVDEDGVVDVINKFVLFSK